MNDTDPMRTGYEAYMWFNREVPASSMDGEAALTALPCKLMHDVDRVQWMRGWDQARADEVAGKVDIDAEDVE